MFFEMTSFGQQADYSRTTAQYTYRELDPTQLNRLIYCASKLHGNAILSSIPKCFPTWSLRYERNWIRNKKAARVNTNFYEI